MFGIGILLTVIIVLLFIIINKIKKLDDINFQLGAIFRILDTKQ